MPHNFRGTLFSFASLIAALTLTLLAGSTAATAAAKESSSPIPGFLTPGLSGATDEGRAGRARFVTQKGVFRVRMVGYQINRWSVHSPPDGICSGELLGNGFERVVFRSPEKRMRLSAFGEGRLTSMILPGMKVRGQLTRKGSYTYTPAENPADDCPTGDGGGDDYVPRKPDCGTRTFKGVPMSVFALDGYFKLISGGGEKHRPRFMNCPSPRVAWPVVIDKKTNGKPIQTRFAPKQIFNPKFNRKTGAWSKVIMLARGVKKQRTFTNSSVTRLQWKLVMKRLR